MNPQQARALIERFRTPEFWDADSAPSWAQELEGAIDEAAHTERWIGRSKEP